MRKLRVFSGIIGASLFLIGFLVSGIDIWVTFFGYPNEIFKVTLKLYWLTAEKNRP